MGKYSKCTYPECFECPYPDCVAPYQIGKIKLAEKSGNMKCSKCEHRDEVKEFSYEDKTRYFCKHYMRLLSKKTDTAPKWCDIRLEAMDPMS